MDVIGTRLIPSPSITNISKCQRPLHSIGRWLLRRERVLKWCIHWHIPNPNFYYSKGPAWYIGDSGVTSGLHRREMHARCQNRSLEVRSLFHLWWELDWWTNIRVLTIKKNSQCTPLNKISLNSNVGFGSIILWDRDLRKSVRSHRSGLSYFIELTSRFAFSVVKIEDEIILRRDDVTPISVEVGTMIPSYPWSKWICTQQTLPFPSCMRCQSIWSIL